MKARIKNTDEIYDIASIELFIPENPLEDQYWGYCPEDIDIIDEPINIDWEQRRFELVKAAMQGLLSTETFCMREYDTITKMAIKQADSVLSEYRKESEK